MGYDALLNFQLGCTLRVEVRMFGMLYSWSCTRSATIKTQVCAFDHCAGALCGSHSCTAVLESESRLYRNSFDRCDNPENQAFSATFRFGIFVYVERCATCNVCMQSAHNLQCLMTSRGLGI